THVLAGATLSGTGTIAGNVVIHDGATVAPGLTIGGTVTHAADPIVMDPSSAANHVAVFTTDPDGTLRVAGTVSMPSGQVTAHVAVRADQAFAYIPNSTSAQVMRIDLRTLQVTQVIAAPASPRVLALSPDGSRLYVGEVTGGLTAYAVDATTGTLTLLY